MSGFPRVALGSLGKRAVPSSMAWALASYLTERGLQVRHFHSRACYCALEGAMTATGSRSRHFDSWLMSRDVCRHLLAEAYASADFVLVEGRFDASPFDGAGAPNAADPSSLAGEEASRGGSLESLCRQLDLPRLVVLDAALAADCRIPPRPDAVDGVLVDGVLERDQFARIQTCLEGAWGVPVVGGLARNEAIRQALVSLPAGSVVPPEICRELAASFAEFFEPGLLDSIAERPTLPKAQTPPEPVRKWTAGLRPTIAVAYDEAFCGYFPDMLETLERHGARVVDFSPLRDESLPEHTDVVLFGCGRPDVYAERLSANFCMHSALGEFARRGGRIYAEGGGCAYLGRSLRAADGQDYPMANVLPLYAVRRAEPVPPEAVEFTVDGENWLLPRETPLRGYRGRQWDWELLEPLEILHVVDGEPDLIQQGNVVGGRLQLHLAVNRSSLEKLLAPAGTCVPTHSTVGIA